ncbi:hypothetical protein U1Q18_032324 [Sarracenia purpurea var. burkii]
MFFSPVQHYRPPSNTTHGGSPASPASPTNISHLVFGLVTSINTWKERKPYIDAWWRPNATRGNFNENLVTIGVMVEEVKVRSDMEAFVGGMPYNSLVLGCYRVPLFRQTSTGGSPPLAVDIPSIPNLRRHFKARERIETCGADHGSDGAFDSGDGEGRGGRRRRQRAVVRDGV